MPDRIIQSADGSRVAIEVTTLTRESAKELRKACNLAGGPAEQLRHTWTVRLLRKTWINRVSPSLMRLLIDLEAAGVKRLSLNDREGEQALIERLREVHAVEISSVDGPGWILFSSRHIGVAASDGSALNDVASYVINDPMRVDNARKVRSTGLAHRHLILFVDSQAAQRISVEQALRSRFLPLAPPAIGDAFTGIWIAVDERAPVARWTRELGWTFVN